MQEIKKKDILQKLLLIILIVMVSGNLLSGFYGFLVKGGDVADDFTMRYRESKYVAAGINPFDVIFGLREETSIGSLWDVAGYTPWGMVFGIVLNFTFLPERYARYLFCAVYLCLMAAAIGLVYQVVRKRCSRQTAMLIALTAAAIPGWGTGLSWLNFGALFGAALFLAVLIMDRHPVLAGVLFGLAATKPQLALPFYLGLLIKKKYRVIVPAVALPFCAWLAAALLTSTGLFEMLLQYSGIINEIGGQLGNWASSLSVYYDNLDFAHGCLKMLAMASCILLAVFLWYFMHKNGVTDLCSFFAVPAILSGMWTYSQAHDRTVWILVIVALAMKMVQQKEPDGKLLGIFFLSLILDTSRAARLLAFLVQAGSAPSLVLNLAVYVIWIWGLLYLAACGGNVTKSEVK